MSALVVRADAAHLPLPDASVNLIVASPPYWSLRSYTDGGQHYEGQVGSEASPQEFLDALWTCTQEWQRVLKPSGSMFINLGDSYAGSGKGGNTSLANSETYLTQRARGYQPTTSGGTHAKPVSTNAATEPSRPRRRARQEFARPKSLQALPWRYAIGCIDQLGLILRSDVIWEKLGGFPDNAQDRVNRDHEYWFHFTVRGSYFYNSDVARIGSVWDVAPQPLSIPASLDVLHIAAFPSENVRRIVHRWSPVGGTVVDPFGGTGTTAAVASALGRIGISVDLSHDYSRLAQWRTTDPATRAKIRGERPPVKQADGQEELFGSVA